MRKVREPFNGLSHLLAAIAALGAMIWLLTVGWGDPIRRYALLIYSLTLFLMFACSAAYHSIDAPPKIMLMLQKFDHSAIYLLIAGSYTPVCLHFFEGFWRWPFLSIVWALSIAGVILKIFLINTPRWISAGLYLLLGWLSVLALGEILHSFPPEALAWLLLGGFFFTSGAMVYIFKKPNLIPNRFGFHEIWHIFVILGAFSHFMLIARFVA